MIIILHHSPRDSTRKMGWIRTTNLTSSLLVCYTRDPFLPATYLSHISRAHDLYGDRPSGTWCEWMDSNHRLIVGNDEYLPLYYTRITRGEFILIPNSTRSIAFVSTWSHPCFPLIPTSQCQTTILRQRTRVGLGGEATTWHEDRPDVSPNYLEVSRKSLPSGYILPFCCREEKEIST